MFEETEGLFRYRLWSRVFWPIYLAAKFTTYGALDSPTHIMGFHTSRAVHLSFYLIAAILVLITIGQTPRKLLEYKAVFIWVVAFSSIVGDLVVHNSEATTQRILSSTSWVGVIIANQVIVRLRISMIDESGRS